MLLCHLGHRLLPLPIVLGVWGCQASPGFPNREEVDREALARFDINGDGGVDPQEYSVYDATPGAFFSIDANGDQRIDAIEFGAWADKVSPRANLLK